MARTMSKPRSEKRIAAKIHKCDRYVYIVPDQQHSFDETFDAYVITLDGDWGYSKPISVNTSNFKFCPYCGERLCETYERDKSEV